MLCMSVAACSQFMTLFEREAHVRDFRLQQTNLAQVCMRARVCVYTLRCMLRHVTRNGLCL